MRFKEFFKNTLDIFKRLTSFIIIKGLIIAGLIIVVVVWIESQFGISWLKTIIFIGSLLIFIFILSLIIVFVRGTKKDNKKIEELERENKKLNKIIKKLNKITK